MAVTIAHVGGVRRLPCAALHRRLARPASRLPRAWPASCSSPSFVSRFPSPTSRHEHRPRRHLASPARPSSCASAPRSTRTRRGARAQRSPASHGEAVCLSTCNRTELYLADESGGRSGSARPRPRCSRSSPELGPALYRLRDEAAALHLFRVAAGLDSMVPGEGEILGQVREAHDGRRGGADARPALPPGASGRQEGARADRDRREPGVGLVGGRGAR